MIPPIVTHQVTVTRGASLTGDVDDTTPASTTLVTDWPVAVTTPRGQGRIVGRNDQVIDMVLTADTNPTLEEGDVVADDAGDASWRILWTELRPGPMLAHQTAGLRQIEDG